MRPNGVGELAEAMLRDGLIRECPATSARGAAGRPRVPLEIDPARRHVIGLALEPGRIDLCRLGLNGQLVERLPVRKCADPARLIPMAASLLAKHLNPRTLGVGVSITGFVDSAQRKLLFSSATKGGPAADLSPVFDAAANVPVILENDMHALAARWLITHGAHQHQDVLLVWIADGRLGAAMLINGRPNRGCATGANDLGHTRYFVDTARCFCGHTGCLERIVSTGFLHRHDKHAQRQLHSLSLAQRVERFVSHGDDPPLDEMIKYLTCSLANSVNFVRPHRLVLVSDFAGREAFAQALVHLTRAMVLPQLVDRVQCDLWDEPRAGSGETAAWLAMAELLYGGWNQSDVTATALKAEPLSSTAAAIHAHPTAKAPPSATPH